ncbi:MAG TPA: homocysteine S-methyltransferase family protein [Ilumatobacteraceae bacterium]
MFLTDGGIETSLIYDQGLELPEFAAFTLLDDDAGRAALIRYFEDYVAIAARDGVGIVLETATWRANPAWGATLGYDADALEQSNREAVALLVDVRRRYETSTAPVVISGCIGPRGDGYQAGEQMTPEQAEAYHSLQARAFADSAADVITAITMTYPAEAIGVVRAARAVGMPVVISFTVETDGRLPSGHTLADAIALVDASTGAGPAYYMVNCAHPDHFAGSLDPSAAWTSRIGGIRANASRMSHAELDAAVELDAGDPVELARLYSELRATHPSIVVLGGCCGTNHEHIGAISSACATTSA